MLHDLQNSDHNLSSSQMGLPHLVLSLGLRRHLTVTEVFPKYSIFYTSNTFSIFFSKLYRFQMICRRLIKYKAQRHPTNFYLKSFLQVTCAQDNLMYPSLDTHNHPFSEYLNLPPSSPGPPLKKVRGRRTGTQGLKPSRDPRDFKDDEGGSGL